MYKWLDIAAKAIDEAQAAVRGIPFDCGDSQQADRTLQEISNVQNLNR